jgi:hypothetical protein
MTLLSTSDCNDWVLFGPSEQEIPDIMVHVIYNINMQQNSNYSKVSKKEAKKSRSTA